MMLTITAATASVLALYFIRRAMRGHGNLAEYVPIALLLMALAELIQAPRPLLVALGVALIAGRILHRSGIRHPERACPNRVRGMQLTFAAISPASISNVVIGLVRGR